MAQLRRRHDEIVERGARVVVVGPEGPDAFRKYWRKEDMPFLGLPDPAHEVLRLFGQEFKILRLGRMPAQVVVDRDGTVRAAWYGSSMSDIPSVEELLEVLDGL